MTSEALLQEIQQFRTWVGLSVLALLLFWETFFPFIREFKRGGSRERLAHGLRNLAFAGINAIIGAVLFGGVWAAVSLYTHQNGYGILQWVGASGALHAIGAIVLWDFWTYWWHRFNHVVPFLWRFHQVHHSDPDMDVTTAYRFHIGEIVMSSTLRIGIIFLVGSYFWELVLYETLLFVVVQFHHANIGVSPALDRILRVVIPSPFMHKVHHSTKAGEYNSNYTSLFSVWDRLFGSFVLRADPENIEFGLPYSKDPKTQRIVSLLRRPLR